ncbi:hypothetical protein B0T11DRAFT_130511 [Plectosphaerella cucumerina]|uniref:Uncharacterized protein n=1 Tax=Plectosphaerella cucumerina TaxID=40658 RepID=A0A8K0T301_9PEZI|nr:hypothetical protein B0T11DRAFT_130511 [Plectosphaerella cucumerina]
MANVGTCRVSGHNPRVLHRPGQQVDVLAVKEDDESFSANTKQYALISTLSTPDQARPGQARGFYDASLVPTARNLSQSRREQTPSRTSLPSVLPHLSPSSADCCRPDQHHARPLTSSNSPIRRTQLRRPRRGNPAHGPHATPRVSPLLSHTPTSHARDSFTRFAPPPPAEHGRAPSCPMPPPIVRPGEQSRAVADAAQG